MEREFSLPSLVYVDENLDFIRDIFQLEAVLVQVQALLLELVDLVVLLANFFVKLVEILLQLLDLLNQIFFLLESMGLLVLLSLLYAVYERYDLLLLSCKPLGQEK